MAEYIPPKYDWVRQQVELYESSGGTKGTTLLDTGLPCIIVTHVGTKPVVFLFATHYTLPSTRPSSQK